MTPAKRREPSPGRPGSGAAFEVRRRPRPGKLGLLAQVLDHGERLVVTLPEPPTPQGKRLLAALGVELVIDPSAPEPCCPRCTSPRFTLHS